jgi:superoxide dismutase
MFHRQEVAIRNAVTQFLAKNFGTIGDFKTQFVLKASGILGSRWAYPVRNVNGMISTNQCSKTFNSIKDSGYPILVVDT